MSIPAIETVERRAFAAAVRDFGSRHTALRDSDDVAALRELSKELGGLGWIGVAAPEEYGGSGGAATDACLLLDELAYARVPLYAIVVSMIVAKIVERFGTEQQKHDIVGAICDGEIASVAMSEPAAGSDVGALSCRAVRTDDSYVINGQKTWISCAHYAARMLLVCRTDNSGAKHDGVTMLDVPTGTPGVEIHQIDTLGGREVNDIFFTDATVGTDHLVGVEGAGWRQLMAGLNFERLVGSATFLGRARRIFDDTLRYVDEREQFGRPVGSFQVIRHRLADLATELECCRLLVYEVARLLDEDPDRPLARQASMAKLKTSEVLKQLAVEGMQLTGGMGYTKEFGMEEHLRQAIVTTVYGGTSEIQREIIANALLPS